MSEVLERYKIGVHHVGKLAVTLDREAIFGESVMGQCTPLGGTPKFKGLPVQERTL